MTIKKHSRQSIDKGKTLKVAHSPQLWLVGSAVRLHTMEELVVEKAVPLLSGNKREKKEGDRQSFARVRLACLSPGFKSRYPEL